MRTWLWIGVIIVGGILLLSTWLLPGAFSAKGKPSELENKLARLVRHWATPSAIRNATNPISLSPEILEKGLHHFADHCATCHANDGSGKTDMGPNFYPPTPDLRDQVIQSMSDGELFYIIHYGIRFTGMPAWGKGEPEKDMDSWMLVHFIRHLPKITPEEIAEMKKYNPMSQQKREEQEALERFLAGEDVELPAEHQH